MNTNIRPALDLIGPHSHEHSHAALTHEHEHRPDIHHRHRTATATATRPAPPSPARPGWSPPAEINGSAFGDGSGSAEAGVGAPYHRPPERGPSCSSGR